MFSGIIYVAHSGTNSLTHFIQCFSHVYPILNANNKYKLVQCVKHLVPVFNYIQSHVFMHICINIISIECAEITYLSGCSPDYS